MRLTVLLSVIILVSCRNPTPTTAVIVPVEVDIKEIDGKPTNYFFRQSIIIPPGEHTILLHMERSHRTNKIRKETITFNAQAGHKYQVRKETLTDITPKRKHHFDEDEDDK